MTVRLDLTSDAAIGPSEVLLLEAIASQGSIRGAARSRGISYRHAWLLIDEVEQELGGKVAIAETGGRGGGGTALTALGREVIELYRAVEKVAMLATYTKLLALSGLARPSVANSQRR
jgi:molybdate transport system regulatory protein